MNPLIIAVTVLQITGSGFDFYRGNYLDAGLWLFVGLANCCILFKGVG